MLPHDFKHGDEIIQFFGTLGINKVKLSDGNDILWVRSFEGMNVVDNESGKEITEENCVAGIMGDPDRLDCLDLDFINYQGDLLFEFRTMDDKSVLAEVLVGDKISTDTYRPD